MKTIEFPAGVQFEITPQCNHNCIHCYNYWRAKDEPVDAPLDDMTEIARKIARLYPTHVTITGGEPLLRFNEIRKIVPVLKQSECTHISINTNAALVTDNIASFLAENDVSAFVSLPCGVSDICDAITSTPGSFQRISRGIQTLVNHNVKVAVNMVVSNLNKNKVYDTAYYASAILGVRHFFASPVSSPINAGEEFRMYKLSRDDLNELANTMIAISKELRMKAQFSVSLPYCTFTTQAQSDAFSYIKHCTAGRFAYAVDYVGDVKACPRDSKKYGNILREPFEEIWMKMEEWRDKSLIPIECKQCKSEQVCGGGCRLEGCSNSGRRDLLDERANLEFAPLKFDRKIEAYPYDDNQKFYVNPRTHRIKEKVGIRINVGTEFLYITPKLNSFLSNEKTVSLSQMLEVFQGASKAETKLLIGTLLHLNVLIPSSDTQ